MNTREFTHLVYGELVKQYGRNATLTLASWDQLPEADRERWISAMAVIHDKVFPHGPADPERYKPAHATPPHQA